MSLTTDPDFTIGSIYESIETNLWLAQAYAAKGSDGLAKECIRAAYTEWLRFDDDLRTAGMADIGKSIWTFITAQGWVGAP